MSNIRGNLNERFKHNMAIINGEEYISMDVFQSSVSELALSDAVMGCIALKLGSFKVTYEELADFMSNRYEDVEITFKDGIYEIKRL